MDALEQADWGEKHDKVKHFNKNPKTAQKNRLQVSTKALNTIKSTEKIFYNRLSQHD